MYPLGLTQAFFVDQQLWGPEDFWRLVNLVEANATHPEGFVTLPV